MRWPPPFVLLIGILFEWCDASSPSPPSVNPADHFEAFGDALSYILAVMAAIPLVGRTLLSVGGSKLWEKLTGFCCGADPFRQLFGAGEPWVKCKGGPNCQKKILST